MANFEDQAIKGGLIQEVKELIENGNPESVKRLVDEMRPADLADLIEHLNADERLSVPLFLIDRLGCPLYSYI